ncbi:Hemolysin-type calcium-binding region [Mesorhizobium opportunistum WSM2075]|uniref:Hemolysin-type calcium-binding region n=2 Tax=Mesorhizobium opportunistum TaxID=593909 RepID=F7Y0W6_MESOW|nr:Hemolysin-type calcium-binding region [Mesorhizobium opportunistum WSM2075]
MTTNIELDTAARSWDEHSAASDHHGQTSPAEIQVAQAASTQPAAAEPVPVDVGSGAPVTPEAPAEAKAAAAPTPHEYVADASNVVKLPANVSIDNIKVDGHNLVLEQADGSVIVIKDGALHVPAFLIGDVEVPRVALIAALEASHVDVAFGADGSMSAGPGGSTSSAGGDFSVPAGGIGDGFDLSALLPPTDLAFGQPEHHELFPSLLPDSTPSIIDLAPENTGGDTTVYEKGLTSAPDTSEINTGTFTISSPDGVGSLTIAGQAISGAALANSASTPVSITTPLGSTLTITGYDASTGQVSYSYTLVHSEPHPGAGTDSIYDNMTVTVTDTDGDTSAPATLSVQIVDDVPVAVNDSATQATENAAVAVDVKANDTAGADGVDWSGVTHTIAQNGANPATGSLAYNNDGTFTYTPGAGEQGTVKFDYTIKDGDGDTSTATVTITLLTDSTPTITVTPDGGTPLVNATAVVDEKGLPTGTGELADHNAGNNSDASETTAGTFNITTSGDTLQALVIIDKNGNPINVTAATVAVPIVVHGTNGDLTVTSTGGVYSYSYTLAHNVANADPNQIGAADQATGEHFAVTVTDSDGDTANGSLTVKVNDDGPHANNDSATQTTENMPVTIDALANDVFGADGVAIGDASKVTFTQATQGVVSYDTTTHLFTYTPNAGAGGSSTADSFTYTVIDGDGDKSTATVSLTLKADSTPTITVTPDGGTPLVNATAVVDEKGLPTGTGELADHNAGNNSDASETTAGTFNITTSGDTLQALVIIDKNGNPINVTAATVAVPIVVHGTNGDLTVTSTGGVYSYSYTLAHNVANADPNQIGAADQATGEHFTVTVTDSDGDTANGSLTVKVNDDGPTIASIESQIVANSVDTHDGTWSFTPGADGLSTIAISLTNEPSISLIHHSTSIYDSATGVAQYTAFFDAGGTQPYFTVDMKADGTYTFEVINPAPTIVVTDTTALGAAGLGGNSNSVYLEQITVKNHFPVPHTDILFTGNSGWTGTNLGSTATVNSNNNGLGIGSGQTMDHNESITLKFLQGDGDNNSSTHSTTAAGMDHVQIDFLQGSNGGQMTGNYSVHVITYDQLGIAHNQGNMNIVNGVLDFTSTDLVYGMSVVNIGNTGLIVAGTTTSVTTAIETPPDVGLHFNVDVVDGDGDKASHGFDIIVDANDGHQATLTGDATYDPNILSGGPGDDILVAAAGYNILTGGAGADTFKLDHLDIKDLISDYSGAGGQGDKIDLTALFDMAPGGTITDYVQYNAGTKTLSVDVNGATGGHSFVDLAQLTNTPAAGTINILYDDSTHTQQHVTI